MRILFFKGIYDTLDLFTEELNQAFVELGYSTFIIRTDHQKEDLKVLKELVKEPCVVVTFNNLGYNLELTKGKNIWEQYGIPYVNILMDHPFHYEHALEEAPATSIVLCIDRNHVKYIRRFFKNVKHTDFLPHAGCAYRINQMDEQMVRQIEAGTGCAADRNRLTEQRRTDVLYAGSLSKYKIERLIPDFGTFHDFDAAEMSGIVLGELANHPERTTEETIEGYLDSIGYTVGKNMTDEELGHIIARMRFIDGYAVSFFREQAVHILVDSGIPVTVYGDDWEKCDWSNNPNLHIAGKVTAPEILPAMQQSKIVLNTMTWFKDGTHDRVFNGMLCGAGVVTDPSLYMREEFENHKELEFFELNRLRELPELVEGLLSDQDRREHLAIAGQHKALENHTWKKRAEQIICILKKVQLMQKVKTDEP